MLGEKKVVIQINTEFSSISSEKMLDLQPKQKSLHTWTNSEGRINAIYAAIAAHG